MPLVTEKFVFYHLPKTGGTWIRTVIRRLGLKQRSSGQYNGSELGPREPDWVRRLFAFTFIRHPLSWYESYWAFKTKTHWDFRHNAFDRECGKKSFEHFIQTAIEKFPGHYSKCYVRRFCGDRSQLRVDFVGRYERLADDLSQAFRLAGCDFEERILRETKPQRVASRQKRFRTRISWPETMQQRLCEAERETIERFYPDRS